MWGVSYQMPFNNAVKEGTQVEDLRTLGKPWIPFFDDGDGFLRMLLEMGQVSPTWGVCEEAKTKYVTGGGFSLLDGEFDPDFDQLSEFDKVEGKTFDDFKKWAKKVNHSRSGGRLLEVMRRAIRDYLKTGNAFVLVKTFPVGRDVQTTVHHLPVLECRLGVDRESVYHSETFRDASREVKDAKQYPLFPMIGEDPEGIASNVTVIHILDYEATHKFYGLPSSIMGLITGRSEYQGFRFRLTQFEHGWSKNGAVVITGNQVQEGLSKQVQKQLNLNTGEGNNAGMDVYQFSGEGVKADVLNFDNDKQGEFLDTTNLDTETIYQVHQMHPVLTGKPENAGLRGGPKFAEVFTLVSGQVIRPLRNKFITEVLIPVAQMAGFEGVTPVFKDSEEIRTLIAMTYPSGVPETVDEKRAKFGLDPIGGEQGEQLLTGGTNGTNNSGASD